MRFICSWLPLMALFKFHLLLAHSSLESLDNLVLLIHEVRSGLPFFTLTFIRYKVLLTGSISSSLLQNHLCRINISAHLPCYLINVFLLRNNMSFKVSSLFIFAFFVSEKKINLFSHLQETILKSNILLLFIARVN